MKNTNMNSRISSCRSQIRWQHSSHICDGKIHNEIPIKIDEGFVYLEIDH